MNEILLTRNDFQRIYNCLRDAKDNRSIDSNQATKLLKELQRAEKVESTEIPSTVVTMNSLVKIYVSSTKKSLELKLVYPKDANIQNNQISILSPLAMAIIGQKKGDVVEWDMPNGKTTITIEEILYQPEASGDVDA